MQKITIEQLNEIISTMDLEKIKTALEQQGYRHASKNGVWEFDMIAVSNAEQVDGTEWHEDTFDDRSYHGDIHTQVKEYPNATFIVIAVKRSHRHLEREEYERFECFTDLPVNEEYEQKQSELKRCTKCGKKFPYGELVEMSIGKKEHLLCDDCFDKEIRKSVRRK